MSVASVVIHPNIKALIGKHKSHRVLWAISYNRSTRVQEAMLVDDDWPLNLIVLGVSRSWNPKATVDIVIFGLIKMFLNRVAIISTNLHDCLVFITFLVVNLFNRPLNFQGLIIQPV